MEIYKKHIKSPLWSHLWKKIVEEYEKRTWTWWGCQITGRVSLLPYQYLNGNDPTNVLSQRGNLRKFENNRSFIHSTPINIEKRPSENYYIKNKIENYFYFQLFNGF